MDNKKLYKEYDYVVLGAGIFGLYTALTLSKNKKAKIAIIEKDDKVFSRASKVNQARVHNGYHYPRSIETASKAAYYYNRFRSEFEFAVNGKFKKIYAISNNYSKVDSKEFFEFCKNINIPIKKINQANYFKTGMVEEAFETEEVSFDYGRISKYLFSRISKLKNVDLFLNKHPRILKANCEKYLLQLNGSVLIAAPVVINSTYASVNQILDLLGLEKFNIKYELCEVITCKVSEKLKNLGITVMDGPFFSIMPFGNSGCHTLTSVSRTPHMTSYEELPEFSCQKQSKDCSSSFLNNCNDCKYHPKSAWKEMYALFRSFMKLDFETELISSMYAIKPILLNSEMDDSRPTIIKEHTNKPRFISIFSGKISSIFDLEKYFNN